MFVEEGDLVRKGQVLARLENQGAISEVRQSEAVLASARAEVDLARSSLRAAEREVDRLEILVDRGFVTGRKMDKMADAVVQQRATLTARNPIGGSGSGRINYNRELTYVRAPVDGRIVRHYVDPGSGASTLNVPTMFGFEPVARPNCPSRSYRGATAIH